jgi:hypothetical protein
MNSQPTTLLLHFSEARFLDQGAVQVFPTMEYETKNHVNNL